MKPEESLALHGSLVAANYRPAGMNPAVATTPYNVVRLAIDHVYQSKSFKTSVFQCEKMSSVGLVNRLDGDVPRVSLVGGCIDAQRLGRLTQR